MPRLYYDVRAIEGHWEVALEGSEQPPQRFASREGAVFFARTSAEVMQRTGCRAEVRVHDRVTRPQSARHPSLSSAASPDRHA